MILEKVIDHAIESPNNVAIVDDKRTLTYRELVWASHLFVNHLRRLAPQEKFGDNLGLLIPPSSAFAVALGGARWDERILMPLNYLLKPNELLAVVKDSGMKLLVAITFFKPMAEALQKAIPQLTVIYIDELTWEKPSLMTMASIGINPKNLRKHLHPVPARKPEDVAVVMYTSGTAGLPKGVMLTNQNLESNATDSCDHARFTDKTVFLGVLPMFHTLGLQGCLLIPMMLGSKVIYQARFSPVSTLDLIQKHAIEVLIMVPTMYAIMAGAKSGNVETMKSVKIAVSGGEPLPVTLIEQFQEKFGITLMEGFGLTETSPIVSLNMPWAHKPGSAGKIIPEVRVKTVDEAGNVLPIGVDGGELYIQGPNVMKGYYNQPELTAEVLTSDRWFKTGDIARIDDEGYLYITGRKKDMIIMAGEKVFPREIEDAIKQHPAVVVSAVIGVKDPARGEMPVAFVQLKSDADLLAANTPKPTAQDIRAFVRERIAPYKAPKDVYFLEEMPKSPTGKVLKRELKIPA